MDDIFVYSVKLPTSIDEIVMPCNGGYTVYLADRLDQEGRMRAYAHAMKHIMEDDFGKEYADQIELVAHEE
ncbi:MAG: hypothetical protein IKF99_15550 [Oscillospiraceae bacterium]|nr:hypothetical protein [Oscillospiraceae bacterium]MBR3239837.1 hypothetical protein [Oscillospiraceae bacterium]